MGQELDFFAPPEVDPDFFERRLLFAEPATEAGGAAEEADFPRPFLTGAAFSGNSCSIAFRADTI